MFLEFHTNPCLSQCVTSYFLTLIPKNLCPQGLGDFRPIALLGSLYKLISKVLAARLATVMDHLFASNQSAIFKKRNIVDGVVVLNEIVDLAKKRNKELLFFKVDIEKAFDSVCWEFLDYMLHRFGFYEKWRSWIQACIFCVGQWQPHRGSQYQRGLKQGDLLAPFLFLLVVEGLGGLIQNAISLGHFRGFRINSTDVVISHLQYVDDTTLGGEACDQNLWAMKAILRCFELVSGLKINFFQESHNVG